MTSINLMFWHRNIILRGSTIKKEYKFTTLIRVLIFHTGIMKILKLIN